MQQKSGVGERTRRNTPTLTKKTLRSSFFLPPTIFLIHKQSPCTLSLAPPLSRSRKGENTPSHGGGGTAQWPYRGLSPPIYLSTGHRLPFPPDPIFFQTDPSVAIHLPPSQWSRGSVPDWLTNQPLPHKYTTMIFFAATDGK